MPSLGLAQPAAASLPDPPCERPVFVSDVAFSLRGDELRIVIANRSDRCTVRIGHPGVMGRYADIPFSMVVLVTAMNGETLSNTDADVEGQKWSSMARYRDRPVVFLQAGESYTSRVNVSAIMREMAEDLVAAGRPELPWGEEVFVELEISVMGYPLFHESDWTETYVSSPKFTYRLPPRRPD